ncbi:MAG: hypothetical protein ACI8PT_002681 [Gammaproteobacteria bacterium]|jgi:hypothetical protein
MLNPILEGGTSVDLAKQVIVEHSEAINARDARAYTATMAFPFTYQNYNGVALTIERGDQCGVIEPWPWEIILRTDPDWSYTDFDEIEAVARSVSSAVFKVGFRRVDVAGKRSGLYDAIWIATWRDESWGVQFRHNLGLRM